MKKYLTKILFIFAIVFCFTLTISAQKTGDDKKGGRKPPVIVVPDKKSSPKDGKSKDKKKTAFYFKYIRGKVGKNV